MARNIFDTAEQASERGESDGYDAARYGGLSGVFDGESIDGHSEGDDYGTSYGKGWQEGLGDDTFRMP